VLSSHLLNQGFHVAEIVFQRAPAGSCQLVFCLRQTSFEVLRDRDVACVFEFAGMDAQVPIGCVHQVLQITECHRFIRSERADNPQAQSFMNQSIKI